jgi:ATP-dependent Clp protease protease subunit
MKNAYDKNTAQYLRESRVVYLCGNVTTASADEIVSRLFVLDALDHQAEIKLYITSHGGSVYAGLAIYDAMQTIEAPVSTLCVGATLSIAACLLAAGARGRRFATANSRIMMHQASVGVLGTSDDIRVAAAHVVQTDTLLVELIARHTRQPEEDVRQAIERDLWMTPEEAHAFGIIDGVLAPSARKASRVAARAVPAPYPCPGDAPSHVALLDQPCRLSAAEHAMLPTITRTKESDS